MWEEGYSSACYLGFLVCAAKDDVLFYEIYVKDHHRIEYNVAVGREG